MCLHVQSKSEYSLHQLNTHYINIDERPKILAYWISARFKIITLFLPFTTFVVCSFVRLCILLAYIANNMDSDQTPSLIDLSGFIVFVSMVKCSSFEYMPRT